MLAQFLVTTNSYVTICTLTEDDQPCRIIIFTHLKWNEWTLKNCTFSEVVWVYEREVAPRGARITALPTYIIHNYLCRGQGYEKTLIFTMVSHFWLEIFPQLLSTLTFKNYINQYDNTRDGRPRPRYSRRLQFDADLGLLPNKALVYPDGSFFEFVEVHN